MLQKISISNKCLSFELSIHQRKLEKYIINIKILSTAIVFRNFSWGNQHISMISEGSCDTEDWSNDAVNSALLSQE